MSSTSAAASANRAACLSNWASSSPRSRPSLPCTKSIRGCSDHARARSGTLILTYIFSQVCHGQVQNATAVCMSTHLKVHHKHRVRNMVGLGHPHALRSAWAATHSIHLNEARTKNLPNRRPHTSNIILRYCPAYSIKETSQPQQLPSSYDHLYAMTASSQSTLFLLNNSLCNWHKPLSHKAEKLEQGFDIHLKSQTNGQNLGSIFNKSAVHLQYERDVKKQDSLFYAILCIRVQAHSKNIMRKWSLSLQWCMVS